MKIVRIEAEGKRGLPLCRDGRYTMPAELGMDVDDLGDLAGEQLDALSQAFSTSECSEAHEFRMTRLGPPVVRGASKILCGGWTLRRLHSRDGPGCA